MATWSSGALWSAGIPKGNDGAQGIQGIDGGVGAQGPPFANDPASQADMEVMRAAYNALVLALRR